MRFLCTFFRLRGAVEAEFVKREHNESVIKKMGNPPICNITCVFIP